MKLIILYNEVSLRKICKAIQISRSLVQHISVKKESDLLPEQEIVELVTLYGGDYRRITALLVLLRAIKSTIRKLYIVFREVLVLKYLKIKKRGRLWDNNGSCIPVPNGHKNYVWSLILLAIS